VNCIYFLHPTLTLGSPLSEAASFYDCSVAEIERYSAISPVRHTAALIAARPTHGDTVAFFNRPDNAYSAEFQAFLVLQL
jgi:hypothetical protein